MSPLFFSCDSLREEPARHPSFGIESVHSRHATDVVRREIADLCTLAYGENITEYLDALGEGEHLLARVDGVLVSHAMVVTRWLQVGESPPVRAAYVELVATRPSAQRNGYASEVMRRVASEIDGTFEMAALSPATPGIYERLGWRFWRGPLSIRMPSGPLVATPDDAVMVLDLPGWPKSDVDQPLSAEWRPGEMW